MTLIKTLVAAARYLQVLACPCAISQQLCDCAMAPNTMMHLLHPASLFTVRMEFFEDSSAAECAHKRRRCAALCPGEVWVYVMRVCCT